MSYGLTAALLAECFPLDIPLSTAANADHVQQSADRLDAELGDEQEMPCTGGAAQVFIEGCPRNWDALPEPDPTLTVGIDGGYVRKRDGDNRKAGVFEVIVGKSMPQESRHKRFGAYESRSHLLEMAPGWNVDLRNPAHRVGT